MAAELKAIVGLGNPGKPYQKTRHNIGFLLVESIAKEFNSIFVGGRKDFVKAETTIATNHVLLIKPLTFMNNCGFALRAVLQYYALTPEKLLIVCDDINLLFGVLRLRSKGGDGGHKGLASIIAQLGTEQFPRLRVGIGADFKRGQMVSHVLSKFDRREKKELSHVLARASQAAQTFITSGIQKAMNDFN